MKKTNRCMDFKAERTGTLAGLVYTQRPVAAFRVLLQAPPARSCPVRRSLR